MRPSRPSVSKKQDIVSSPPSDQMPVSQLCDALLARIETMDPDFAPPLVEQEMLSDFGEVRPVSALEFYYEP